MKCKNRPHIAPMLHRPCNPLKEEIMNWLELFFFGIEILGILAFTISGALVAMEHDLDLFGVFVLTSTTSLGGGILRDIILNRTPPVSFQNPTFFLVSFAGTLVFIITTRIASNFFHHLKRSTFRFLINLFDAMGLGVFCIIGVNAAFEAGYSHNLFLSVFTGVITGIGGGILRDLLVNRKPIVLYKEIYALAAIIGCIVYTVLWLYIPKSIAMLFCVFLIILIRMISIKMNLGMQFKKSDSGKINFKFRE